MNNIKGSYPSTEKYRVVDTLGVPHPYTIGPKHVAYAADRHGGMLSEHTIEEGERRGIHCAHPRCTLSYKEHEQALVVECKEPHDLEGLRAYLQSIKEETERNGYVGFVLLRKDADK